MMRRRVCETDVINPLENTKKKYKSLFEKYDLNLAVNIDKPLPSGEILVDVTQKQWRIGKPIGHGSFGEIYLASDDIHESVTVDNSRYVIKIEPHSNGPLFVEIHCLIRSSRHSKIQKWLKEKKLKSLGMPHYIANGSHLYDNTRYRFLVLPRYDCDIEKIISSHNYFIHPKNILVLAVQIIDILEYLHTQGYAHSDIKSSNLMVGYDGSLFVNKKNIENVNTNNIFKKVNKSIKPKKKYSSYYYDEDFVLHNYLSSSSDTDYETEEENVLNNKTLRFMKNSRFKKPINQKNCRKRLFNLRKLKSDINYVDVNSSICSYDSYQDLLENNNIKCSGFDFDVENIDDNEVDHFKEAIQSQSAGQVYLLDFGLATKFINSDGTHKEYGMDQRKAHDGTLEYSSRDSHIGAHARRSDLENLGYNIIDWLTGSLPWKTVNMLTEPDLIHAVKNNYIKDIKKFMEVCFKTQSYPEFVEKYFMYIKELEFTEKPDYRYCKSLFITEFVSRGYGTENEMILNFNYNINPVVKKKNNYGKKLNNPLKNSPPDFLKRNAIVKVYGRENSHADSWESDIKINLIRTLSSDSMRKPCVSRNFFVSDADLIAKLRQTLLINRDTPSKKFSPKNLRSTKKIIKKKKGKNVKNNIGKFGNFLGSDKQYTWAEILAGNPESFVKKNDKEKSANDGCLEGNKNCNNKKLQTRKASNASEIGLNNPEINASPNLLRHDFLIGLNPTYAMKEVVANYKRKILGKPTGKSDAVDIPNEHGYTPAMIRVIKNMEKRKVKENQDSEKPSRITRSQKVLETPIPSLTKSIPVKLQTRSKRKVKSKSVVFNTKTLKENEESKHESNIQTKTTRRTVKVNVKKNNQVKPKIIKNKSIPNKTQRRNNIKKKNEKNINEKEQVQNEEIGKKRHNTRSFNVTKSSTIKKTSVKDNVCQINTRSRKK